MAMDICSSDLISLTVTDDSSVTWNHGIRYNGVVEVVGVVSPPSSAWPTGVPYGSGYDRFNLNASREKGGLVYYCIFMKKETAAVMLLLT